MNFLLKKILGIADKNTKKASAKRPDEDFIPYVCHYDPETMLTKNGELLQVIRITGFSNSTIVSELTSLRESVRESIAEHVEDNKVAFWLNTIRRKKNISPAGEFNNVFAESFDKAWEKKNKWDDQYVNELYITVIVEGFDTSISNMKSFLRSFSYLATKSLHHKFLKESKQRLSSIVANVIKDTEEYGAKLLGIKEWEGVLYSEPMRFFGKINNLYEERYPVVANDASSDLSDHKIAFGDRQLEVVGDGSKHFAAILSLKEYSEILTTSLDRVLQLPFEFIITQSFDFAFSQKELEPYEYQDYILKVSGDESFRDVMGIDSFLENKKNQPTDYGKLQTTIMIVSDDKKELERDIKMAVDQFSSLGLLTVREDIFLEHCFWSQLPGNFRYLRRQKLINTNSVAGFAALHNYPSGMMAGNKWGPAVTVLKTILNTPYFFNFHDGNLGHTLITGTDYYENARILNFLISQSNRFANKTFIFDLGDVSKCFVKSLSGSYYSLTSESEGGVDLLKMNPLALEKTKENKEFLIEFFASLVTFSKEKIAESEIDLIPQILEIIFTSEATDFASASEYFNSPETNGIYEALKVWNDEKLQHIFAFQEEIDWSGETIAFNLTEHFEQKPILIPAVLYLLHKIEASLDGSPAIIAINEALELLDNDILAPKIVEFLKRVKEKNCIVIFTSSSAEQVADSDLCSEIRNSENLAAEIFLPNSGLKADCVKDLGLSGEEAEIIRTMNRDEFHFLFKHAEDTVISSLDLSSMIEFKQILAADEITLAAMEEVISAHKSEDIPNPDSKLWLPQLFEVLKGLESERIEEEKQKQREEYLEQKKAMQALED